MKRLITYTALALCATLTLAVASPETDQAQAREKAAWEAYKGKKEAEFRKMISDNYHGAYSDGIYDLAREMKSLQEMQLKSYALSDLKVVTTDADTQIVTYKVTMQYSAGGKDGGGNYNAGSVWQKQQAGDWKVIFHTNVKEEKP